MLSRKSFCRLGATAVFCCSLALQATWATAQSEKIADLTEAAKAGDLEAQFQLGQVHYYGLNGATRNREQGLALMEGAAEAGYLPAQAAVGAMLFYSAGQPAAQDKGLEFLEIAAAAGHHKAQTTLAVALLWGLNVPEDLDRSRSLLTEASDLGNTTALRVLGAELIKGSKFEKDRDLGLTMLQQAVAAEDTSAKVTLGSFYLNGHFLPEDRARAVTLFEEAAAVGNGEGLERLGAKMMWSQENIGKAEAYLNRAAELGQNTAWSTLASGAMWGYLGERSRGKFDAYARRARASGQSNVAVLEAKRRLWGISMRASGPEAIEILEIAAETGNREALKYLVALTRNGNGLNVRKDPERARAYLERFSSVLSPQQVDQLSLSIDASKVATVPQFRVLKARYDSRPDLKSFNFGKELFAANPNFAVYLLQAEMKAAGRYGGALNGLATPRTLSAIQAECQRLPDTSFCGDTVLDPNRVASLLAQ